MTMSGTSLHNMLKTIDKVAHGQHDPRTVCSVVTSLNRWWQMSLHNLMSRFVNVPCVLIVLCQVAHDYGPRALQCYTMISLACEQSPTAWTCTCLQHRMHQLLRTILLCWKMMCNHPRNCATCLLVIFYARRLYHRIDFHGKCLLSCMPGRCMLIHTLS